MDGSNNEGDKNFINRFFKLQEQPKKADLSIEENVGEPGTLKLDPNIDTAHAQQFGRLTPHGEDLTGKDIEFQTPEQPQAVEAPAKPRNKKPRAQAYSKRTHHRGRRMFLSGAAGFVGGLAGGYVAKKAGESAVGAVINAWDQNVQARLAKEKEDEEKRKKLDAQRGVPHLSNAEILERIKKD